MKTSEKLIEEIKNAPGKGIEKIRWIQDHGSFKLNAYTVEIINVIMEGVSIEDLLNGNCDMDALGEKFQKRIEDERRVMICN